MTQTSNLSWSGKVPVIPIETLEKPAPRKTVVTVPGSDAPLLEVAIPDGVRGSARERVANRYLQDNAGLQPDLIEIRPFDIGADKVTWTRALVIEGGLAETWRARAGRSCRAVLPDYLTLPVAPDIWTLYFDGTHLLARLGLGDAFSAEPDLALPLIEMALSKNEPKAILKLSDLPGELEAILASAPIRTFTKPAEARPAGLEVPQVLAHGEERFDLRKDPRAARDRVRRRILPWVWPLGIATASAAVWAGALWLETDKLRSQTEMLQAQARDITRDVFVLTGPILDPRTQIMRELQLLETEVNASRSKVSSLDLFSEMLAVISQSPAKLQSSSISEGTALVVTAELPNFAELDATVALIGESGLVAEVVRSDFDSVDQVINAELNISFPEAVQQ